MRCRHAVAFVAGFVAVVVAAGTGAYAYWTATAAATGQVATRAVAISHIDFPALGSTLINTHETLSRTGSFTVTNTGELAGTATIAVAGSPAAFADALPVTVWPVGSPTACSPAATVPGAGAITTTWAAFSRSVELAAGAAQTFCARTTVDPATQRNAIASAGGSQTLTARLSATLSADGWTATAAATSDVATFVTREIYPLTDGIVPTGLSAWVRFAAADNSAMCLDVKSSGTVGADLISWTCDTYSNKTWQVAPVVPGDMTLVTLRPGHDPGSRLARTADGRETTAAAQPSSLSQQWYVQKVGDRRVQLVSALDGRCLTLRPTRNDTAQSVADCIEVSTKLDVVRAPMTATVAANGSSVEIGLGAIFNKHAVAVQRQQADGTWVTTSTSAVGVSTVTFNRDYTVWPGIFTDSQRTLAVGANTIRIVYAGTSDVIFAPFTVTRASNGAVAVTTGVG